MAEFHRPSVEEDNGTVVCVNCSESVTTDEAAITMDNVSENPDGDILYVARYYVCSDDCAEELVLEGIGELPHESSP